MSKISNEVRLPRASTRRQARISLSPLAGLLILALLMALVPARADEVEDAYVQILYVIKQGDELSASGKAAPAKTKYLEALRALVAFQKANPDWQAKIVSFRIKNLAEKMAEVDEKAAAPPVASATTNASKAEPAEAAAPPAPRRQVKLLDPGAEPRKELRLHPAPGDKQTVTLTLKMGSATSGKTIPGLTITLESNVKQVADNGSITYTLLWSDLSVSEEPGTPPATAAAMKMAFAALKGTTGTGTVSSQGMGGEFKVQGSAGGMSQTMGLGGLMQDLATQMVVALPAEPVGVGAKWQVTGPIKSQGMTMDQTDTYELVSLEGERLTVKDSTVESAGPQKIQNRAVPGLKLDLVKMTGKSTTERTADLAHLLPLSGSGKSHTETAATMEMNGKKSSMTEKTDVEYRIQAK